MRSQRTEADGPLMPREKSKGTNRRPKAEKSEENTIEKLSTQLDSEQPIEQTKEKKGSYSDITSSLKKKAKFNSPLGPDQMKKDIYKRLDSNMEWIMKRITKDQNTPAEGKNKIKLFFNKSVYEVDTQEQEPKKPEHDMKKVYKELKESFNLLYSPDLVDQESRLRKINGIGFFNEPFMPPDENCKSVRGTKRQEQGGGSVACKREMKSPKQSSLMESKRTLGITATPKNGESKPQESLLSRQVMKAKVTIKGTKTVQESPKKNTEPSTIQDSASKSKATHQKAHSNLEKRLEKSCMAGSSSTILTKKSERKISNIITNDLIKKKPVAPTEEPIPEDDPIKHIPSIHRSFSSYYMRHFNRTGPRFAAEKKTYDMREADPIEEDTSPRDLSTDRRNSISQSKLKDRNFNSVSLVNASNQGLDSFYRLIFELDSSKHKSLQKNVSTFISDMIKTMQDFTNRFPHGAPPPERSVNLPGKSKPSMFHLTADRITILFDLDETLVHCSIDRHGALNGLSNQNGRTQVMGFHQGLSLCKTACSRNTEGIVTRVRGACLYIIR